MKYSFKELLLIFVDSFSDFNYEKKQQLYSLLVGAKEIAKSVKENRNAILGAIGVEAYAHLLESCNNEYLEHILSGLNKNGITAVTIESEDYPESLKEIATPPLVLYAKGDRKLLKSESFAIVGSRRSLPLSIGLCEEYAKAISDHFTVITGIAEGVDSTAIKTALDNGGKVISVIAGGFDNLYPKENQNLLDRVIENGLAITEYPLGVKPKPYFFPYRNRLIAFLSKGVLIVNGGIKSGVRYTANYAGIYGRDLFAIPYSVGVKSGEGSNEIIKSGAMLTTSPKDILSFYGKEETEDALLTDEEKEFVSVLDGSMHVEKIAEKLGKNPYELLPTISALEIKGIIKKSGMNEYSLIK